MAIQPYRPASIFRPTGRELRAISREEEAALARVNAAYTVASAGAARYASLCLSAANFAQIVSSAGPGLQGIADGVAIVVVAQVTKFAR